jgi:segregation and condensation protein B
MEPRVAASAPPDGAVELIGAALLAAGRPVTVAELAGVLGLNRSAAEGAMEAFAARLSAARLGVQVESVAGGYRLMVPPELAGRLAPLLAPPPLPPLSEAALEVLAIVAYRQPVMRAEIEAMRGGPAGALITLQERELIKVAGRAEAVGRPLLYATTEKFLLEFGLAGLNSLPRLEGDDFSGLLRS